MLKSLLILNSYSVASELIGNTKCSDLEEFRRVSAKAVPRIAEEGVLPDVDSRTSAAAGKKATEGGGMGEGLELAKLARRDRQNFDCATWLHKARQMPKEDFKKEVEKELTGRETEPWEIVYFKLYQSQMPVVDRAIETPALMLGTDKSRGYCLEMICADFLAGANLDHGDPETLLFSMTRFFKFLPGEQRQAFLADLGEKVS
ncbi:MAG: hypothetical protein ABR881_22340 [Candidatus Sulfotelmatobacter sp.]|jgi:hypothetical protein